MKQKIKFQYLGIQFSACVNYTPATPDVMYMKNGDPGYPGDPEELEIDKLYISGVDVTALYDEECLPGLLDAAMEAARESHHGE